MIPLPKADSALGVMLSGFIEDLFGYEERPKHTSIPGKILVL